MSTYSIPNILGSMIFTADFGSTVDNGNVVKLGLRFDSPSIPFVGKVFAIRVDSDGTHEPLKVENLEAAQRTISAIDIELSGWNRNSKIVIFTSDEPADTGSVNLSGQYCVRAQNYGSNVRKDKIGSTVDGALTNHCYLVDLIGNEYGAAGAMGNLYCESGLDPMNLQDSYEPILGFNNDSYTSAVDSGIYSASDFVNDSAGYGLAQWTWNARKQSLYNYCKTRGLSIGDIDGQLGYLGVELRGSFSGCLSALQNASSVEEASRIFMLRFEAPNDQSAAAIAVRRQYAEYYYNKFV